LGWVVVVVVGSSGSRELAAYARSNEGNGPIYLDERGVDLVARNPPFKGGMDSMQLFLLDIRAGGWEANLRLFMYVCMYIRRSGYVWYIMQQLASS
jgi:hypothetical protein